MAPVLLPEEKIHVSVCALYSPLPLHFTVQGLINSTVIFTSVHFSQMNGVHLMTVVARLVLKDSLALFCVLKNQLVNLIN